MLPVEWSRRPDYFALADVQLLCIAQSERHTRLLSAFATAARAAYNSAEAAIRAAVARVGQESRMEQNRMMTLRAGDAAPDFELPAVVGETKTRFRLSNFKGRRHVVMAFYALDWTPT